MHTKATSRPLAEAPENDDCFAVRQAARHLSQLYERHLVAAGLTPTQFSILGALGRAESLTMAELARAMVMERTTLIRALRPLLRAGLVADVSIPGRRAGPRRLQLELTGAGRARFAGALVCWRAAQDEFERRFGPRRAAWLRRELFRVTRAVVSNP
ncbi:MarR family transcriptional regulator [Burkholderia sp. WAC0059]|uniref:MarR family winged helix-turn-helix transcriptional regulator n=1 Tax=Burkholderia sp. WAC0059 TaxID=2066022 RepID=UPI000C7E9798|nr:MarR family transcriptional regulator [Burkholderia sp. WAC0059]PLZ00910.1 MarR family transcriptional regulator [Burkholderia sp. WAC0059]